MKIFGRTLFGRKKLKERDLDEIKGICRILFIDDKSFPIIDILKKNGWKNIQQIKDVDALEQVEVRDANILFVDIQGVGRRLKLSNEGLDLIVALKTKFPKKVVIAYSAEDQGQVQAFHPALDMADSRISKNAKSYEFEFKMEKYARELFSLSECINRVREILTKELGVSPESNQIIAKLENIYNRDDTSVEYVGKVFNLQNASNLASIIQLFFLKG
jgi:hypothetical protein